MKRSATLVALVLMVMALLAITAIRPFVRATWLMEVTPTA